MWDPINLLVCSSHNTIILYSLLLYCLPSDLYSLIAPFIAQAAGNRTKSQEWLPLSGSGISGTVHTLHSLSYTPAALWSPFFHLYFLIYNTVDNMFIILIMYLKGLFNEISTSLTSNPPRPLTNRLNYLDIDSPSYSNIRPREVKKIAKTWLPGVIPRLVNLPRVWYPRDLIFRT